MPEAFCHEMQAGGSLYCVAGTGSDDNAVRLEITAVDSQGSVTSVGELSMPLARARRVREVVAAALKRVEKIPTTKTYSLEELRQEHPNLTPAGRRNSMQSSWGAGTPMTPSRRSVVRWVVAHRPYSLACTNWAEWMTGTIRPLLSEGVGYCDSSVWLYPPGVFAE